jgi:hypothetical protein
MREVAPGDLILSFVDTRLVAIGIARSYCWESPKPSEFGNAGQNWEDVGWRVRVAFTPLLHQVRPKDHIDLLRPLPPTKYSPLQVNGNGLQSDLVASHCKPWRDATNEERLNGENGLLLTPTVDHLFDRGFIGFEDDGRLILSPVAHRPSLQRMGINVTAATNVGSFTSGQKTFLDFHRQSVLLQSFLR